MSSRIDRTIILALAAIGCLLAMIAVTLATGVSQETFEIVRSPAVYAADLVGHATAVRWLFGIDSAFLVLYAAFFVAFGRRIATAETRTFVAIAIGALLLTALLDMVEDHHILAMLYGSELGSIPTAGELTFQHSLSQVKFNVSYLGTFFLGLAIPRGTIAGRILGLLLTVGTLVQSAWLYAAPVAMLPSGNLGRWIGFLAGFALAIRVSRSGAAGATATGAPA